MQATSEICLRCLDAVDALRYYGAGPDEKFRRLWQKIRLSIQSILPPDEILLAAVAVRFVRSRYVPRKFKMQRVENERLGSCRTCPGQPSC